MERCSNVVVGYRLIKFKNPFLNCLDIAVENCAICRGHIMDLCIECQASTQANGQNNEECTVAWGACNVTNCNVSV